MFQGIKNKKRKGKHPTNMSWGNLRTHMTLWGFNSKQHFVRRYINIIQLPKKNPFKPSEQVQTMFVKLKIPVTVSVFTQGVLNIVYYKMQYIL